ncbi:MAG: metallophosphoesterase [Spirochaetales bacterium]|nr:metallophosphoesterase [Spirochaetales bacterium]
MKILCVADHIDPLVYSPGVKERFREVQLVLSAGDLPHSYYDFIMSTLNKPLLFVFGNHNLRLMPLYRRGTDYFGRGEIAGHADPVSLPSGAVHMDGRVRRVKSALVAGLGGSLWYNGGENQFTDFRMALKIARMVPRLLFNRLRYGRYLDILLTHAPPFGIHDGPDRCHVGFKPFLWFMRAFRPRYLIHGHIHLYSSSAAAGGRRTQYHETAVVNAYDHVVVDLEV